MFLKICFKKCCFVLLCFKGMGFGWRHDKDLDRSKQVTPDRFVSKIHKQANIKCVWESVDQVIWEDKKMDIQKLLWEKVGDEGSEMEACIHTS